MIYLNLNKHNLVEAIKSEEFCEVPNNQLLGTYFTPNQATSDLITKGYKGFEIRMSEEVRNLWKRR